MVNDAYVSHDGKTYEIVISTRQGDQIVTLDSIDWAKAEELTRLSIYKDPKDRKLARAGKEDKQVLLHRHLFDIPKGSRLIWKNGDTLDLRRSNLQLEDSNGDVAEMAAETEERKTSDVPGVKFHKATESWEVRIYHKGTRYSLGYFKDVEEAESEAALFRSEGPESPKLKRNKRRA